MRRAAAGPSKYAASASQKKKVREPTAKGGRSRIGKWLGGGAFLGLLIGAMLGALVGIFLAMTNHSAMVAAAQRAGLVRPSSSILHNGAPDTTGGVHP